MTDVRYAETWTRTRPTERARTGDPSAAASSPVSIAQCSLAPEVVGAVEDRRNSEVVHGRLFMPIAADVLVGDTMISPRGRAYKVVADDEFEHPLHPMTGRVRDRKFVRVRAVRNA